MDVAIIEPHGFCLGVRAAVETARRMLSDGVPVWCLHELVHNATVVAELREKGMRFVESPEDVPEQARVMISAHGAPPEVLERAVERRLQVTDATCPFVARTHRKVREFAAGGIPVVVVGNAGHVEVRGLVGECRIPSGVMVVQGVDDVAALPFPEDAPVGVVCQTTLSSGAVHDALSALRARYPRLVESAASETCTATRDRQAAVVAFVCSARAGERIGVLVLGSANSSNTTRLADVAREAGAVVWRIDGPEELAVCNFMGIDRLGVTAGASTPESAVQDVLDALKARSRR